jgi:hypothetical protein
VCLMRVVSWNIRGLGGLVRRKEVRKLVGEKNPSIVCLLETKLSICDDFHCSSLWGNAPYAYSFRPSVGASGGLLTGERRSSRSGSRPMDHILFNRFIEDTFLIDLPLCGRRFTRLDRFLLS